MRIPEFKVETWMTDHELDAKYNLTETCMQAMKLQDILSEEEIRESFAGVMDYGPITGSQRLKKAILSLYETGSEKNIALTHGAINANELVLTELLEAGDEVVCMVPTYAQLYDYPASIGCCVKYVRLKEENHWQPVIDDFKAVVTEKTKLICINSPNNPTGTFFTLTMMKELIELAESVDCYILCDEVYRGLNTETGKISPSFSDYYEKAIVTQSLSKAFSFAGLRCGWIKADEQFIHRIDLRRDYHIISQGPLIDHLSALVLEHKDEIIARNVAIAKANKVILKEWLDKTDHVKCVIPDEGPVCLLQYDLDIPSVELCERLQKETGVFFVPGACFDVEHAMRLGLTHYGDEFEEGLKIFADWLKHQV